MAGFFGLFDGLQQHFLHFGLKTLIFLRLFKQTQQFHFRFIIKYSSRSDNSQHENYEIPRIYIKRKLVDTTS